MSDPFIAEIRIVTFNFAPRYWAQCNGQLLPLSQNTALFSLLGTMYGGDGKSTFALPDFRGRFPMHQGQSNTGTQYFQGQAGGSESVTLLQSEMPAHTHMVTPGVAGSTPTAEPANAGLGTSPARPWAASGTAGAMMSPAGVSVAGGDQPHNNMPPYLALNFVIALQGIFPPRN